jgi:hypothetical protein
MAPSPKETSSLLSDFDEDDSLVLPTLQRNEAIAMVVDGVHDQTPLSNSLANNRRATSDSSDDETGNICGAEHSGHIPQDQHAVLPVANQQASLTLDESLVQLMVLFPDIEYQYLVDLYKDYVRAQQLLGDHVFVRLEGIIEVVVQKKKYPTEGARRRALKRKREEEEKDPHNFRQWTSDGRQSPTPEYLQFV